MHPSLWITLQNCGKAAQRMKLAQTYIVCMSSASVQYDAQLQNFDTNTSGLCKDLELVNFKH